MYMYNTYLYITYFSGERDILSGYWLLQERPIHHTIIHAAKILMLPNAFSKLPKNSLSFIFLIL